MKRTTDVVYLFPDTIQIRFILQMYTETNCQEQQAGAVNSRHAPLRIAFVYQQPEQLSPPTKPSSRPMAVIKFCHGCGCCGCSGVSQVISKLQRRYRAERGVSPIASD